MPLLSSSVGTCEKSSPIIVPTRWLLAYAAALGVSEELYADDARSEGIEALPFLCTRFEWIVQQKLRVHPALGLDAEEARRGVHFLQDSRFLAPIRPGMMVAIQGEIREVREVRAGALIRYAYILRDLEKGTDLVQTRSMSIYRDVSVKGEARTASDSIATKNRTERIDLANGTIVSIEVSRAFPQIYTECADIWNPIHTERRFALGAGLEDIILHGTATWALAGRELLSAYAADHGSRLSRLTAKFTGNVVPPSILKLRHAELPQQPGVVNFDVLGGNCESVLSDGVAVFTDSLTINSG